MIHIAAIVMAITLPQITARADDTPTPPPSATPPVAKPADPAQATPAQPAPVQPQAQTQTPAPAQPPAGTEPAPSATVDVADLMTPGTLPEISMGDDKAPITIVEYHSMTCPHCAHFEKTVLPTLEDQYIKTGKVRFIMRGFPLNQLDAVAFMLLRCRPTDTYLNNMKLMYDTQETWAFTDHPKDAITALAKKIGFTQESFESCLKDQTVWDGLVTVAKKADETFKVDGTPAFFFNGVREGSIGSIDELTKKLEPFVKP
jgi:protein-disulfide isomerase